MRRKEKEQEKRVASSINLAPGGAIDDFPTPRADKLPHSSH